MLRSGISCLMLLAALVVACGAQGAKDEKLCTPNANVFCRCEDRSEGTKKCREDGASFDECLPCDGSGDTGVGSGGSDGLGGEHGTGRGDTSSEEEEEQEKSKVDAGDPSTPQEGQGGPVAKKDAGSPTKPQPGPVVNAPHCKTLKNVAPRIELQRLADSPTAPTGGKPIPGLYVQSWVIEFTGDDGESGPSNHYSRETIEIFEDGVGRYVFEDDDGAKASGGFRLSEGGKNKINVAYECPAAPPKDLAYDATEGTLVIYDAPYARVFYRQVGGEK